MAIEIKVPTLGESVTSATIARWLKQPGDSVAADEPVASLETDKVNVDVPAPAAGRLGAHQAGEGDEVEVGAVIATIEDGEGRAAAPAPVAEAPAAKAPEAKPTAAAAPKAAPAPAPGESFDLIVIGAGPGGYVCAIRAAQLGLKVACVEKRDTLGGTCLNIGCIPSKALLQSSENYHEATGSFAKHGIVIDKVGLDLARMQARKAEVVEANVKGVEFLFRKNKVTWLKGTGRLVPGDSPAVEVDGTTYGAKSIVIATGSDSIPLPGIAIDERRIVSSTGALELDAVPRHLVVVGAGVIGLELGSVWHRLGAEVTVVEFLDRILPGTDDEIATAFQRILGKQGLKFRLGQKVTKAETTDAGVTLTLEPAKGGEPTTIEADIVLVAIGRRAVTDGLGAKEAGVALDSRGRITVDSHYATSVPGIYAIGDVIEGPMLAHKAEEEGVAVAELLAGQSGHVNYEAIPGVIYTWPEVATVGATEENLKSQGIAYKVGKFPFTANGRARAMEATDGFVKILADKATDRLLGAHIVGPDAGALIAELVTALEFGASAEDVARICHAHPTLSEAVKEAALAVEGRALHI
ncbi:dihydrolipoamide dehydrogenase [Endobacter medicaginis]|uniref:Dihydrolipoyl dehydrogenase n=3 Tax=Endobacter medicaginis TaxID=1181271 RepID=A0A839UTT4_9PROT|nr:dihydrolipoyl dehydrogenase [Endobacter medicaginis]MBB3173186.1 dihydrolipoamide dehydrogenase [Endobacter medicaginis]MCX5476610.1 dihydrolipoyl dehydrogenase [Endobacter medicaginis]